MPPTASARIPAKTAVCCSVSSACAEAASASLGIFVETESEPPRLIAVGMASEVACVLPSWARTYSLVGLALGGEVVLGRPLRDEHRVVEARVERDGVEHPDDAEVDVVEAERSGLTRDHAVLLREPLPDDGRAAVIQTVALAQPAPALHLDLERVREIRV